MRSLFLKELRSLAPFAGLILFFQGLNLAELCFTEFPDQFLFSKALRPDENNGDQVFMFVVAFALAAGLLVREQDEGTLRFLDALPISRTRIFFGKLLPALGVLWLSPLGDLALRTLVFVWSRTSLETHFPAGLLLTSLLLQSVSCLVFLALGLALSFLRRFSFLVFGLLVMSYLLLAELRTPFLPFLNIFTLTDPVFEGQHWLIPTAKLVTQFVLALVCLGIAYGGFQLQGDAAQRFSERLKRHRGWGLFAGAGIALSVVVWLGLLFYWAKDSAPEDKKSVHYVEWNHSRATTAHYRFLYPENQAGLVGQLLDRADGVESRVREFLNAQPILRIDADLTGSVPHTAGVAHWKSVQIDLTEVGPGIDDLVAVLGHETTHVYIDHECDSRISKHFNSTRFYHEGLASYVQFHAFQPSGKLVSLRRVAAVMQSRKEVKFDELLSSEKLSRNRDTDLVYPLGEVFVAALVRLHGEAAPGKVVRAFGRPNAPKDLEGFELWQDVLQACGYNFSEVEDACFSILEESVISERRFIDSLPRLRGAVQREDHHIVVRATHPGTAPGRLICRLRPHADTPEHLYEYPTGFETGVFRVDESALPESSFWYQLGWQVPGASQAIYEPWVEVR